MSVETFSATTLAVLQLEDVRGNSKNLPPDSGEGLSEGRNRRTTEAVFEAAQLVGVGKTRTAA